MCASDTVPMLCAGVTTITDDIVGDLSFCANGQSIAVPIDLQANGTRGLELQTCPAGCEEVRLSTFSLVARCRPVP